MRMMLSFTAKQRLIDYLHTIAKSVVSALNQSIDKDILYNLRPGLRCSQAGRKENRRRGAGEYFSDVNCSLCGQWPLTLGPQACAERNRRRRLLARSNGVPGGWFGNEHHRVGGPIRCRIPEFYVKDRVSNRADHPLVVDDCQGISHAIRRGPGPLNDHLR